MTNEIIRYHVIQVWNGKDYLDSRPFVNYKEAEHQAETMQEADRFVGEYFTTYKVGRVVHNPATF